ncbi:MAG: hypothetical protein NTY63_03445 [Candidatus Bipolaricaulota bacterium]|nr:hypothetical protein [Candidatus Bipolaricaulota bacterium]
MGRPSAWVGFILVLTAALSASGANEQCLLEGDWTRVRPSAVWCGDKNSAVTLKAHIVGHDDIRSVRVVGPNESFQLYDDGTHGDAAAGDFMFTAEGVRPYCSTRYMLRYGNAVGTWYGTLEVTLTSGDRLVDDKFLRIGLVHPRYANAFRFETYGDGLSATVFAFFVEDIDRAVFDGYPVSSTGPDVAAREAVQKLYTIFPDRFDFILVMPKMPIFAASDFRERASLSLRVANDALHIGLPIFNRGAEYGSGGFLKGVIYHSFGGLDLVDLEMASLWGADIGASLGLATEIEPGRYLWSSLSDVDGQLSAFYVSETGLVGHFAESNEGTWQFVTTIGNSRYTPLELYTMGLLQAEAVPPAHLLTNPDLTDPQRVTAESVSTITIEDLIAAQGGVRTRLTDATPVEFSVAFVVVGDEPFTSAEYAYFSLLAYELTTKAAPAATDYFAPFYWATGGRAALRVLLPVTLPIPSGM